MDGKKSTRSKSQPQQYFPKNKYMENQWIVTLPKTVEWEDYQKELEVVKYGRLVMKYKVAHIPLALTPGDRCYITWRNKIRGWMEIVGVEVKAEGFCCSTTGKEWGPGNYILRSGPFHEVDGPEYKGFRGIRRLEETI